MFNPIPLGDVDSFRDSIRKTCCRQRIHSMHRDFLNLRNITSLLSALLKCIISLSVFTNSTGPNQMWISWFMSQLLKTWQLSWLTLASTSPSMIWLRQSCSISPVRYESLLGAWENVPYAERTMMPCEIDFFWFKNDLYDVKWMRGLLNVSHHQQMVTTTRLCKLLEVIGDTSTVDFAVDEPVKAHWEISLTVILPNTRFTARHVTTS